MIVMSYRFACVCSRISRMGSPARTTSSGEIANWRNFSASFSSASRSGFSSAEVSAIPSKVVSALVGAATSPARRTGLSAGSVPSLQIRMRISLEFVAGHERINDNSRSNQRQWDKGEPNFRARKILGRDGADLGADRRSGVHHQRDQDIDVALDGVAEGPIAG